MNVDVSISSYEVKEKALLLGFHKVGIAPVDASMVSKSVARLQAWLKLGYQADMQWMANPKRQDIRKSMPSVQSIISVALNYYTADRRPEGSQYGKISRYGWGRDYHRVMDKKLKLLANWLRSHGVEVRYYADTGPVLDKVWAQAAEREEEAQTFDRERRSTPSPPERRSPPLRQR